MHGVCTSARVCIVCLLTGHAMAPLFLMMFRVYAAAESQRCILTHFGGNFKTCLIKLQPTRARMEV